MTDWDRLGKLMRMTESDSDGEALNALRMANRLLTESGLNWSDVMAMVRQASRVPRSTVVVEERKRGTARYGAKADQRRPEDTRRHDGADINVMFASVSGKRHDMLTMTMLAAFRDHWDRHNYLTGAQYDTLKQMYSNANREGRTTWQF